MVEVWVGPGHHLYTNLFGIDPDMPLLDKGDVRRIVKRQVPCLWACAAGLSADAHTLLLWVSLTVLATALQVSVHLFAVPVRLLVPENPSPGHHGRIHDVSLCFVCRSSVKYVLVMF
jgi:hypothetical protein